MHKNLRKPIVTYAALGLVLSCIVTPAWAAPPEADVSRRSSDALDVHWVSPDPVDIYLADRANAPLSQAKLVASGDHAGQAEIETDLPRPFIVVRNHRTGEATPVGERLIPLEKGSNFRDLGGYPVAGGRHVRWGLVFRSGATPLLNEADKARIKALGLADMVDLRSDEERVLAPSRIDGVRYSAIGYSMAQMAFGGGMEAGYRAMPKMLAPQLRLIFAKLLHKEGPLAFNCSAGQDRTGFTAAIFLAALGASPDVILSDYHLSTRYRRPEFEMPKISEAQAADNPVAALFRSYQMQPNPQPTALRTADGRAFLSFALDEVQQKWGSVDAYLRQELGLTSKDIQYLRATYTE